jgi:hypothetical protein
MLTNSSKTKKRLALGFAVGFLGVNGVQQAYQRLLMRKRKHQFRAYLGATAEPITFGSFHRGSTYGYKHIRTSNDSYFAVRQLSDSRFIVRKHSQVKAFPEQYQLTDFDYNFLSDFVYYVDDKMAVHDNFEPISAGDSFDERFQVIKTIDDAATGLQAMVVKVSQTQLVLAYAGTNPLDPRDLKTDMRTIIAKENLPSRENPQQHQKAEAFYHVVRAENPELTITLTGHSLGGFLALYVACRERLDATVFNAPDPHQLLADMPQALKLKNYRHAYDALGNFAGNGTGAELLSKRLIFPARTPFVYHGIATWQFDKNGKIER